MTARCKCVGIERCRARRLNAIHAATMFVALSFAISPTIYAQ